MDATDAEWNRRYFEATTWRSYLVLESLVQQLGAARQEACTAPLLAAMDAIWKLLPAHAVLALNARNTTVVVDEPGVRWQPKGTMLCADVRCVCGHDGHIDATYAGSVQCAACRRVYDLVGPIPMVPVVPGAPAASAPVPPTLFVAVDACDVPTDAADGGRAACIELVRSVTASLEGYLDALPETTRDGALVEVKGTLKSILDRVPRDPYPRRRDENF